ncbi:MAG: hypothetical protein ABUL72_06450, partial [Armatimonadota bacterium]
MLAQEKPKHKTHAYSTQREELKGLAFAAECPRKQRAQHDNSNGAKRSSSTKSLCWIDVSPWLISETENRVADLGGVVMSVCSTNSKGGLLSR